MLDSLRSISSSFDAPCKISEVNICTTLPVTYFQRPGRNKAGFQINKLPNYHIANKISSATTWRQWHRWWNTVFFTMGERVVLKTSKSTLGVTETHIMGPVEFRWDTLWSLWSHPVHFPAKRPATQSAFFEKSKHNKTTCLVASLCMGYCWCETYRDCVFWSFGFVLCFSKNLHVPIYREVLYVEENWWKCYLWCLVHVIRNKQSGSFKTRDI